MVGFVSTDAETDLLPEGDESASVEKTVASYRQIPSADAKMHHEPFAASSAETLTALIAHKYTGSAMIVDTNISPLGNSNVTEMRKIRC